ncbi:MAG: hypothetical protein MJ085_05240 [Clostridia bacterium]|nr:hypothetical protein [Clostridia bacterium]
MEQELDILDYEGADYMPVHAFESWRVAYLNFADRFTKKGMKYIERHLETDEIFILMKGQATLLMGEACTPVTMEPFKVYNVRKGAWHNILVSEDAKVLVIENDNTSEQNSEYRYF